MKVNLLELFSGICGFSMGLEQAGFEIDKHYLSEVDKYAKQVSRYRYPNATQLGSVTTVTKERIKDKIDIITFGSPCQDLSIAGKRKGLAGARSGLFAEAIRIIKEVQPSIFIWENVKGAYSSNRGRDFQKVLQEIANIGLYECEWQLCNTRWVLPQNRERIYLIGHLRGSSFGKVFPVGEDRQPVSNYLRTNYSNGKSNETYVRNLNQIGAIGKDSCATRVYDPKGCASTLAANGGGGGAKTGLYMLTEQRSEEAKKVRRATKGRDFSPRRAKKLVPRKDDLSNTITAHQGKEQLLCEMTVANAVTPDAYLAAGKRKRDVNGKAVLTSMHARRIRRLTPIECERLQGFPDNFTAIGIDNKGKEVKISDTQRYKMCGNAVTTKIVELIGRKLKRRVL